MSKAQVSTIDMATFRQLVLADEKTGRPKIRKASDDELDEPQAVIVRVTDHPFGDNRIFRLNPFDRREKP